MSSRASQRPTSSSSTRAATNTKTHSSIEYKNSSETNVNIDYWSSRWTNICTDYQCSAKTNTNVKYRSDTETDTSIEYKSRTKTNVSVNDWNNTRTHVSINISTKRIFGSVACTGADVTVHPPLGGKWTVNDEEGNPCMKMSLSAALEVLHGDKPTQYNVDQSFAATGICAKPFRQFTLTSPDPTRTTLKELQLTFLFDYTRAIYTLSQIMAVWFDTIHREDWEKDLKQGDNLLNNAVEQSKSYQCNLELRFDLEGGYGRVFLWNIELVPFVEDFHSQAQECSGVTKTVKQCGCSAVFNKQ
ncbi:uncharacterized protein LOC119735905 [Patiria miniata]|uniref:Uncharacterized protein n=1 Tax=Patiria miniata TaxID=46514 RepID=A0A914AQR5_PATMI|nr:uncharacterized protein LOC119735905 [Patiria miniata]